jgi:hypothetical protein
MFPWTDAVRTSVAFTLWFAARAFDDSVQEDHVDPAPGVVVRRYEAGFQM